VKHRGRGEGSITKRRDGRWSAIISLGWENGKLRRQTFYGETREEVAAWLADATSDRNAGLPTPKGGWTVGAYLDSWLEMRKTKIRPRTYEKWESVVRLHLKPDLGKLNLKKLGHEPVQALLDRKSKEGFAPQSVHHMRMVLGLALRQALKWNYVKRNVASLTEGPKMVRSPIKPLSKEAAKKLLTYIGAHRLEALYVMALTVAMRRGEVLGLRWGDVDFEKRELNVQRQLQ